MSRALSWVALGSFLALTAGLRSAPVPPPKDARSPREIEAARDDLRQLRLRVADPKSNPDELWKLWQEFRLRHSGEPEYLDAAAVMTRVCSPLDKLDRRQMPAADRRPWLPKEVVAVLGEHRGRHWDHVARVAFAPDGKLVGSLAETVRLWDPATMQERAVLKDGSNERPWAMAFVPQHHLLATGFGDDIVLWDISSDLPRQTVRVKGHTWRVTALAFSVDARRMASASQKEGIIWDMRGEKPVKLRVFKWKDCEGVALSGDGKLLAQCTSRRGIQLRRLDQPAEKKAKVLEKTCWPVAFSPNNKLLVTRMDGESFTRIWDVSAETPKIRYDLYGKEGAANGFAFSPDGALLASVSYDRTLRLWPLTDAARTTLKLAARDNHGRYELGYSATSVAFSPDGKTIVLGGEDGTVRLWDLARAAERFPLKGHRGEVLSVAFTPDVRSLVSGGYDHTVRWWGLTGAKPRELAVLSEPQSKVWTVLCAPQGRYVASQQDGSPEEKTNILLWDFSSKPPRIRDTLRSHTYTAVRMAFSPNGKLFLTAGDDALPKPIETEDGITYRSIPEVRLWDFADGKLSERAVLHPQYRPDEKRRYLHTAGFGGFLPDGKSFLLALHTAWRVWDMGSGGGARERGVLNPGKLVNSGLTVSPDGKTLAANDVVMEEGRSRPAYYLIRLCERNGLAVRERMQIKLGRSDVIDLAFTPDGQRLLSIDESNRLIVWEVSLGRKQHEVAVPGRVLKLGVAPDGRHVATANANGTVYIYRLAEPAKASGQ